MVIDTPGIDDEGELGALRVKKSYQVLNKTDIGVLVIDSTVGKGPQEEALVRRFREKGIPFVVVYNKCDLLPGGQHSMPPVTLPAEHSIYVSAARNIHIQELKELIASLKPEDTHRYPLIGDLMSPGDLIVLVVPIDKAAPKGRLILPQQQTIRDILDHGGLSLVVRDTELKGALANLRAGGITPRLVVTDSQVFARVSQDTPDHIPLTSFSILFARYKGDLGTAVQGAAALDRVQDGDKILIAEGCTHHRQCDDIGTHKIPGWIRQYTGKNPEFVFTSGTEFPDDVSGYRLVVHCGGCMLNEREMKYRTACCRDQGVPITNYGILIAQVTGILRRSLEPFPDILKTALIISYCF